MLFCIPSPPPLKNSLNKPAKKKSLSLRGKEWGKKITNKKENLKIPDIELNRFAHQCYPYEKRAKKSANLC